MSNHTIFIADLHLSPTKPKITELFLKFLEEAAPKADALYILGDIFQFWVGDDDRSIFNEQIKEALQKTTLKTPIYLMPGNRDFILGQTFAKESCCTLMSDPCKIDLYSTPTLLTHGDILCTKDIKHRVFRAITRFPFGLKIFLKLPFKFRFWLASNIQKYSAKTKLSKDKNMMLPQTNAVKKLMLQFDSKQIIHGHIHKPETEEFDMNDQKMLRISLGDWTDSGSILVCYPDGTYQLQTFV
jgi:UDP-2,3-diacylglucosamine hydrolase